jgi:hypothetical protein
MDLIHPPCLGHHLDPWDSRSHSVPEGRGSLPAIHTGFRVMWVNVFVFLQIWGVRLIWWSIWFSVAWGGMIMSYFMWVLSHAAKILQVGGPASR